MKYVAMLVGVDNLERPIHSYGQFLDDSLDRWAKATLKKYPSGRIEVYELHYDLIRRVSASINEDGVVKLVSESLIPASSTNETMQKEKTCQQDLQSREKTKNDQQ